MRKIGRIKGAVLFTDIKNFTLKTSLLTQKQIEDLLNKLNDIIFPIISKYDGEIVKSLGDSYMIIFKDIQKGVLCSVDIQKELEKYNSKIKFDLFKIELRITIDSGFLDKKFTVKGNDYFGEAVNISSRLQSITDANRIYITGNLYNEIKTEKTIKSVFLGETTFKGILEKVDIYEIVYNDKKINKGDFSIKNNMDKSIKNIDDTIFKFSSVAAVLGIQPIPFFDTYALLPLHLYLLNSIAKEYGIKLTTKDSKEILSTILASIGGSYLLGQGLVGLSKIGTFGLGGYFIIPLNFGLTYAIGKILSYYLYKKSKGIKSTNKELNDLFRYSLSSGRNIAKKDKDRIIDFGKKHKDEILKFIKDIKIDFSFLKNKKNKK